MHDVLYVLMLYEHVMNLSHTPQHPKVEYTPKVKEDIRLVKIIDTCDMQLRDEIARPVKVQWQGRITREAIREREG